MRDYLFILNDTSDSGALLVDVVRVWQDAHLHDLVQLWPDVLVRREVLLYSSLLPLEVLTWIQIVSFICSMVWVVLSVKASSVDFDWGNNVVRETIVAGSVRVLDDGNHTVAVEVSLIDIPLLLLLRNHLVVVIVWHLVLRQVPTPWISSYSFHVIIVTMGGRGWEDVRKS
jgi:hypothetical protein